VSFLKQNSGAKIYISTLPYTQEFQICHIEGELGALDPHIPFVGGVEGFVCISKEPFDMFYTSADLSLLCFSPGTQQQVDKALSLIGKKFKDLDMTNLYAPPPPPLNLPSLPMTSWVRVGSLAVRFLRY